MKLSTFLLLLAITLAATIATDCLAETEQPATVEYIGYARDFTFWHSNITLSEAKQRNEFLVLIVIQDGQKLIIKEARPSAELKRFLADVKIGTIIYLNVGTSMMPGISGSTGDTIKSITNLTTGKKYNR